MTRSQIDDVSPASEVDAATRPRMRGQRVDEAGARSSSNSSSSDQHRVLDRARAISLMKGCDRVVAEAAPRVRGRVDSSRRTAALSGETGRDCSGCRSRISHAGLPSAASYSCRFGLRLRQLTLPVVGMARSLRAFAIARHSNYRNMRLDSELDFRQSALVEVRFAQRRDGIIEASLGEEMPMFSHALNDAVTSRAPRGAVHTGLSTYWIDRVERDARAALAAGTSAPFASGNVTVFSVIDDRVHASLEFDDERSETESVTVGDFFDLLDAWRQRVIAGGGVHGDEAALMVVSDRARPMGPSA